MCGWLVVNSFLHTTKFSRLYAQLTNAAHAQGIGLELKTAAELTCTLQWNFRDLSLPDFVLFWDKDIYFAKRLEALGIPLFNSAKSIALCDNKIWTAMELYPAIPMPKTVLAPKTFAGVNYCNKAFLRDAIGILGLPMVMKEACGSFGKQVYLAESEAQAVEIADRIGSTDFLMQAFVATSRGRDVRINVVGDKVAAAMLRTNPQDFRSNISSGGQMADYTPTTEQSKLAVEVCRRLGLDFAGVDILFGEQDAPLLCEVNSNPHFMSTLECTGVDMSVHIMEHIVRTLH